MIIWRKSIRSNPWAGGDPECVELAELGGVIGVRDSRDPGGPVLRLSRREVRRVLAALKEDDAVSRATR